MAREIGVIQKNPNSVGTFTGKTIQAPGSPFGIGAVGMLFDIDVSNVSSATVMLSGTYTGQALFYEGSVDGSTWVGINGLNKVSSETRNYPVTLSTTGSVQEFDVHSFVGFRCRVGAFSTGRVVATVNLSDERMQFTPWLFGVRASSSNPTPLSSGSASNGITTLDNKLVVIAGSVPEQTWSYAAVAGGIIATGANAIKAAVLSQRNYLKSLQIKTGTLSADTEFTISDGSTVVYRTFLKTGENNVSIVFDVPLRGSVNTAFNAAILTSSTGGVFVNAQGYTGN